MQEVNKEDVDKESLCHQPKYADYWPLFFAETALERRPARNLCRGCPVRLECLAWALENKEIWGVWGGCDEAELRRALWVDANGGPTNRCRFPHCPACKARPSRLVVVGVCELSTGRRRERVECMTCGFNWRASTSVSAVKAYWRDHNKRLRAKNLRARVPGVRSSRRPVVNGTYALPEPDSLVALAASGEPREVC